MSMFDEFIHTMTKEDYERYVNICDYFLYHPVFHTYRWIARMGFYSVSDENS